MGKVGALSKLRVVSGEVGHYLERRNDTLHGNRATLSRLRMKHRRATVPVSIISPVG